MRRIPGPVALRGIAAIVIVVFHRLSLKGRSEYAREAPGSLRGPRARPIAEVTPSATTSW